MIRYKSQIVGYYRFEGGKRELKKKVLCIVVLVALATSAVFALTACNKTPEPPEGTLWSDTQKIWLGIGEPSIFFIGDGTWRMDMGGTAAGDERNESLTWCSGDYSFAVKDGAYVLTLRIDPSIGDPGNVRLLDPSDNVIENGTYIDILPDGNGTYSVPVTVLTSETAEHGQDFSTARFKITPDKETIDALIANY